MTIRVGSDAKEIRVYKDLLRTKSRFFASALKDDWNHKNSIDLEREDVETFGVLLTWMFTGAFPQLKKQIVHETRPRATVDSIKFGQVYKLADFLIMPKAKNDLVDHLIRTIGNGSINFNGLT